MGIIWGYRGLLLHLGINFNPEVSFKSVIYRWKALSRIFLLNILRTLFDTKNAMENLSEGQGGDFVEIAASEMWLITYDDIKLHKDDN